ncbi:Epidermal growth factor-like protein 6, partial [Acropora cervicornis]
INECSLEDYVCNPLAECINSIGSYSCRCYDGYTGNGKMWTSVINCPNLAPKIACVKMEKGLFFVFAKLVLLWKMGSVKMLTSANEVCAKRMPIVSIPLALTNATVDVASFPTDRTVLVRQFDRSLIKH